MSIILNDNLDTQFNKPLDTRFGPYTDVATALAQVPAFRRYIGLTIGIGSNPVVEYWFNDGILDADFVIKTPDINYPVTSVNGKTGAVVLNKTDIGLGNVDNTSDLDKPISDDTQTALNDRVLKSDFESHVEDFNNPHVVTKSQVGLGNVTNVDTTNASNISSGTLGDARLSSNVTTQGNTFNAANKLVQLDATAKLPAVDGSQLTNLPSFTPPNGLLKIASAISTTFQVVKDYLDNASVLFLNSRRVGIGKDTSVTTQSVAVVEVQDTNTSIVLKPNGTGGIIASVPDGTATGGNARGQYAVDLQMVRGTSSQVASQNNSAILSGQNNSVNSGATESVICGGASNQVTNTRSAVLGGFQNHASFPYSSIVGGQGNTASSFHSFIGGGQSNNISSGNWSVVSGGQSNTASTNTHATVVGGQGNTASGQHSVAGGSINTVSQRYGFGIGRNNIVNGSDASAAIGFDNTTSGASSIALGYGHTVNGAYSAGLGADVLTYLYGQISNASSLFSTDGDAQQSLLTARRQASLLTAATTVLSLDGTGTTNLIIPNGNNRAWNVQIDTIAVVTAITGTATGVSVGHCYSETKQLLFKRIGGTSSIVGTVDTSAIKSDSGMATASITISAGGSQQMAITFTAPTFAGGGSVTCRVVSKVSLVEVAY